MRLDVRDGDDWRGVSGGERGGEEEHTNVLWLNVRVHKVTLIMKVLETKKDLPGDYFDKGLWDTLFLVALDESQEVLSKGFEDDAYVVFWAMVRERVEKRDNVGTTWMSGIRV